MKQKLFTLLFTILTSTFTMWSSDTEVDGIWYDFFDNSMTASVTWRGSNYWDYNNEYSGDVTIPESVTYNSKTYSVKNIGLYAFRDCSSLTSVTIPSSVTVIEESAFSSCNNLTSVSIPNSVKSIGGLAFYKCSSLTTITIPNSVTSIGGSAFAYCSSLTSIIIPNSVTSIGIYAFYSCSNLTSALIGNSVKSIGERAFENCSSLTSVTISNSVTSIGQFAFNMCSNLTKVNISDLNTWCKIAFSDGSSNPLYYAHSLYLNDELVTDLLIPDNLTSIGKYAFYNCSSLNSVTIPNSITSIGYYAFYGCRSITSITIPNSMKSIGCYVFAGCSSLTSVTIPNTVTTIEEYAFYNCTSLPSITIPNSVKSIGGSAFYNCSSLTSVAIPNSVTRIGESAFYNCSSLVSVAIPESVTSIKQYAFYGCSNLCYIYMRSTTPPSIEHLTFAYISNDCKVYVPFGSCYAYKTAYTWKNMNIVVLMTQTTSISATACNIAFEVEGIELRSCGIEGGETFEGNILEYIGLEPENEYKDISVVLISNTGVTDTVTVSFTTSALELTTQESMAVSSNTALLFAQTNISDAEVNCGFEWRRDNQPEGMASTKVYAPVANGKMAGRLKGLKDDVYYKYRAFYESSAGNKYYGDWQYIFTGDEAVEFDPVMYTYPASAVTETTATLKGYALAGSNEFTEQGFEYWVEVRIIPVNADNAPRRTYHSAVGEHMTVTASGISMKVTLTDLDEGSVYKYRSYAVVDGQKVYGEEQSFITRGEYLYTVTFVDYDGTVLGSDKVHYGTAATAPAEPTREGYTFDGWDVDFSAVTDDITVTAVYSIATSLPDTQQPVNSSPRKLIKDGQLFILRDGKTYTVQGMPL